MPGTRQRRVRTFGELDAAVDRSFELVQLSQRDGALQLTFGS